MNIYQPSGRAREYSPLALNYFKGCDHGCKYCYVPNMLGRFNSNYNHEQVMPPLDFQSLEISAKKMQGCNKQILLSFTGDPYCGAENGETRKVLEILNKYQHKVAILTKDPERAFKKDIDIIRNFGDRIKIGSTLTFIDNEYSLNWEPGAPVPDSRIRGLTLLSNEGVKTWASFEPVISASQSLLLLKAISSFIDHVKIGKINNYKGLDKLIDWPKFIKDAVDICRENNIPFYIKKDLLQFNKDVILYEHETNEDYLNL